MYIMKFNILFLSCMIYIIQGQKCQLNILDTVKYLGCFVDDFFDRLLPNLTVLDSSTDNNRCILLCRDFRYTFSGTQNRKECHCGNDPWRYTAADVDPYFIQNFDCNHPCRADSTQICGGEWRLSVYTTGLKTIQSKAIGSEYTMMAEHQKINDSITAISSVDVVSILHCATLCSKVEACTGFVHSTTTVKCQLYGLKYQDLCDYTITDGGSSVYMVD